MKRERVKIGCDGFTNAWYSENRLFRVIDARGLGFFSRYRYLTLPIAIFFLLIWGV